MFVLTWQNLSRIVYSNLLIKELHTSLVILGLCHSNTTLISFGSIEIPLANTTCPRNVIWSSKNSYFENLAYKCLSLSFCNTNLKYYFCTFQFLEYTNISSINTIRNISRQYWNTLLIKSIKTIGAFFNPKGINTNL